MYDPILGGPKEAVAWYASAFLALVDCSMNWHQVPKIAAWPS
jgi:hypothetical protein